MQMAPLVLDDSLLCFWPNGNIICLAKRDFFIWTFFIWDRCCHLMIFKLPMEPHLLWNSSTSIIRILKLEFKLRCDHLCYIFFTTQYGRKSYQKLTFLRIFTEHFYGGRNRETRKKDLTHEFNPHGNSFYSSAALYKSVRLSSKIGVEAANQRRRIRCVFTTCVCVCVCVCVCFCGRSPE